MLFAETVEPLQCGLRPDPARVGQCPVDMTGQYVPELAGEGVTVGLDRGGLAGHQQGVLLRTGKRFPACRETLLVHGGHVVIHHHPVIVAFVDVENELARPPGGDAARKLPQPGVCLDTADKFYPYAQGCIRLVAGIPPGRVHRHCRRHARAVVRQRGGRVGPPHANCSPIRACGTKIGTCW